MGDDRWRDALRLSMQAASASVATWVVLRWIDSSEAFVGIISAVLVVQATVDDTVARVRDRLAATAFGSVVGVGCLLALPGPAATPLALALSMAVIHAVATIRSGWRYGAVAAIALSLSSEQSVIDAALDRLLAIGIGAAAGLTVSLVLWPDSAGNRAGRHLRAALSSLGDQLTRSMDTVGESSAADIDPSAYHVNIDKARAAADDLVGDQAVVNRQLTATNRLYNSVLIVRRVVDTSGTLSGIEELDDAVDALRQHARDVVQHLADGGGGQLDAAQVLDDIERRVDRAREALDAADDDRERRTHRHTLLFALRQIEHGLGDLLDSFSELDVSNART